MKSLMSGIIATAAMMTSAMSDAQTIPTAALAGTRLDVTARGEVHRVPDVAVISAGVVTQAADAGSAMRDNAARIARVIAALKKAGIADKDIATSSISLSPQYRYNNNEPPVITGYQANNQLTIRFRDIGKSGAVIDALVKEGANQVNGPTLEIDKPEAALDEARIAATKAARARADLYASAFGMKVKRVISIAEQDGFAQQPMPMMMARSAAADGGEAKTAVMAGEQAIGVTVSIVFELQ
ncbi:MAG: hypothetical protein RL367_2342 [Pseudomonadota bacterium]